MFKNMKIRNRMFFGFTVILILLIAVSVFSVFRMSHLAQFTTDMYNHPLTVSIAIRDAEIGIIKMHRGMKDVALAENEDQINAAADIVKQLEGEVRKNLEKAKENYLGDKKEFDELIDKFEKWEPIRQRVIELTREGKKADAAIITKGRGARHVEGLRELMAKVTQYANNKAVNFRDGAKSSETSSYLVVAIVDFIAIFIALVIAWWMTSAITRPVKMASSLMERLANGDLTVDVPDFSRDEIGMLLTAMKDMARNLKEQMRQLSEGIAVLSGSAAEISTTTTQFSTTTQEVATSVNEVMVSMREVKQTTGLSNEKAQEMAERSRNVVETSRNGRQAVQHTVESINSIQEQMMSIADSVVGLSEQSQSIGEIIAAVDDVADQSRLLAVNASIEAVKAGEQGKGFTVVADEIKSLAQQSKLSTSQVRTILTDIQKATSAAVMATEKGSKAVESGVQLAGQTGGAIDLLGENIEQTSQSAVQIEATSRQQAAGIDQVFSAMESINAAISQSADSARQLENSTRDLDDLGKKIKLIVDKYQV